MFVLSVEKKRTRKILTLIGFVFLLALPVRGLGQAYFGSVTGLLTDPSGALLAEARVTLTDQNKGYKFNEQTDAAGRYLFRSIPPGVYSVTAEVPGFEKTERIGIRVDVNQNVTANLRLKISSSSQTVEVKSQTQGLDAQDATTGLVIDRKFINDLPLIDRYVMDLTLLTPGVTEADDQCSTGCTGTNFVSNGSRNSTSDVLMDGATVTNYEPNGGVTQVTYTPSAGSGGRVQRRAVELQRGVWLLRSIGSEPDHALGVEHIPRQRIRLCAQHDHRCEQLVQQPE